ncbi:MAG: ExbD/TolR family protein [Planctomycetota bacterium]|jgi:biopolymer transport protein ExbD
MAGEQAPLVPGASSPAEMELLRQQLKLRRLKKKKPVEAKMSMTPMIDIVFLLIFFFMVVTDLSNMEIESVALPFALKAQEDKDKEDRVIINITDKGEIRHMRRKKNEAELFALLKEAADRSGRDPEDKLPTIAVKIRGDSNAEYKYIQQVMVQCMRAYIWKLSFGARPAANEDALDRTFGKY